jgi:hypothetical protein
MDIIDPASPTARANPAFFGGAGESMQCVKKNGGWAALTVGMWVSQSSFA